MDACFVPWDMLFVIMSAIGAHYQTMKRLTMSCKAVMETVMTETWRDIDTFVNKTETEMQEGGWERIDLQQLKQSVCDVMHTPTMFSRMQNKYTSPLVGTSKYVFRPSKPIPYEFAVRLYETPAYPFGERVKEYNYTWTGEAAEKPIDDDNIQLLKDMKKHKPLRSTMMPFIQRSPATAMATYPRIKHQFIGIVPVDDPFAVTLDAPGEKILDDLAVKIRLVDGKGRDMFLIVNRESSTFPRIYSITLSYTGTCSYSGMNVLVVDEPERTTIRPFFYTDASMHWWMLSMYRRPLAR